MNFKVLVPIKRVIDYKMKIRVMKNKEGVDKTGMKLSMNPFCEIAIEQAVKMKEENKVSEITALTIGPSDDILRTALAMGVDKAIHIHTQADID